MLDTSGTIRRFSCWYRPGATNCQTWYSTHGSAIRKATSKVTFIGTKNEPVTSVTIILPPLGSDSISGAANRLKITGAQ
ncbi:hypothetical protein D3C72_2268680 [compost metagenome]